MTLSNKDLGLVTTPPNTADYIVSRLGYIPRDARILDPCVGPGAFIKALLNRGVDPDQITAVDINEEHRMSIEEQGVTFITRDALLSLTPYSYNEFDFVVGNPPYLSKASEYIRKNKRSLQKIYGKIHSHEAYAMFIVNGIRRLRNGGKMAFIVSDSFMTVNTHANLRRYILKNCLIDEITLAPKSLFDSQGVNTSPAIIVLTKCVGREYESSRMVHTMRIVERVQSEDEYEHPRASASIPQSQYHLLPYKIFYTEIEPWILKLFRDSDSMKEHIRGYVGMHTMDNDKYIRPLSEVESDEDWKPYIKTGGADQYYRPVTEAVYLGDDDIPDGYLFPRDVPFGDEGIVISGISSRLAARYMPKGCYWDSNKAMGFFVVDENISIEYALGLLNSSLYNHLAKGILNRTNCVQLTDLHALPFVNPDDDTKSRVEELVKKIVTNKREHENFDYSSEQKQIDDIILNFHKKRFKTTEKMV